MPSLTCIGVVGWSGRHLLPQGGRVGTPPFPPWCRQDATFSLGHLQPTAIEAGILTHLRKLVNQVRDCPVYFHAELEEKTSLVGAVSAVGEERFIYAWSFFIATPLHCAVGTKPRGSAQGRP